MALQCPCDGPATSDWHSLASAEQRTRFLAHFRDRLNHFRPVTECVPPFSRVLLYVQGTGAYRFSANTRLPANADEVQHYFDRCIAGAVGQGIVQDLKYVWDECCLFVVRLSSCSDTLWLHLDGETVDFWELAATQDLSLIPTYDGHILYPTEEAHALGYAVRQPLCDAEAAIVLPGPSRLPKTRVQADAQDALAFPTADGDPAEAEILYTLFGTPPEHSVSSFDSSELSALAESVSSSSTSSPAPPATSSSASSSSSASAAPTGAAVSLLQIQSRLRPAQQVDDELAPLGRKHVEIFCLGGESHLLQICADTSFDAVRQQLARHAPGFGDCAFVPVFPMHASQFQCLAIPLSLLGTGCPCLVTPAPPSLPWLCYWMLRVPPKNLSTSMGVQMAIFA